MILAKEGRSYPHASGWSISGASGIPPDDELRRQIRARLSEARLPAVDGVSKSHPGTGRPCVVCRRAIEPTEVERQVSGHGYSSMLTRLATSSGGSNRLCSALPKIEAKSQSQTNSHHHDHLALRRAVETAATRSARARTSPRCSWGLPDAAGHWSALHRVSPGSNVAGGPA